MPIVLDGTNGIAAPNVYGRNLIINGQGRINQRGYVSGTATTVANQYTLDRWRVVVSGQSLIFTGDDAGRTMTAPAGGAEQVIENVNVEGGTYVLNWVGTATATVNGTARAKGETFTLPSGLNATVRFTNGTFTSVQLEAGTLATPFERLPFGDELTRCQRYYESGFYQFGSAGTDASGTSYGRVYFKVTKRVTTYIVNRIDQILTNASASTIGDAHADGFDISSGGLVVGQLMRIRGFWAVDAEIF